MAFYSNNWVNKFFKKPFNVKPRASKIKGSFSRKSMSEENKLEKKEVKVEDEKVEKSLKVTQDSTTIYVIELITWRVITCSKRGMRKRIELRKKPNTWRGLTM